MDDRISVAQVLELGVPLTWQHAVAITLEAWHAATTARVRQQPVELAPESCLLTTAGEVALPRLAAAHVPDGALQLLRAMLDGVDAPAELVDIAFGSGIDTLSDDLALFSRPNRRVEIADVARRGLAARAALVPPTLGTSAAPVRTDEASPAPAADGHVTPPRDASAAESDATLAALRQAASTRPPVAPPPEASTTSAPRRAGRGAAAVVAAALATLAVASWQLLPDAPSAPAATPTPVADTDADEAVEPLVPDPAWSAAGRREVDIALPRRAPAPRAPAPSATGSSATPAAVAASSPTTMPPASETVTTPAEPAWDAAAAAAERSDVVYTWQSEGVEPPTMIQPRMPRSAFPEPDDTLGDQPYLEVLVNESGDVDAVRMRGSQTSRQVVRHGMMLAAAKAWHFSPALRDGRPVRYVVRVLVAR